jgi:hypothetical protein
MEILIIGAVAVGAVLLLGGLIWGLSWAIDTAIKDYIDYARKEKDHDRHRRT